MNLNRVLYHVKHSAEYAKEIGFINLVNFYYQYIVYHYCDKRTARKLYKIEYRKYRINVYLRTQSADMDVFGNICLGNSYEFALCKTDKLNNVKYIIDAGANIGIMSCIFLSRYPDAKVVAMEPDIGNFKILRQNTKKFPHATAVNCGIWNKATKLKLVKSKEEWGIRVVEDIDFERRKKSEVQVLGMIDIMKKYDIPYIDILKIDIEGSEYQLFDDSAELWIDFVRSLIIEIHDHLVQNCYKRIHTIMIKHGFKEYKSPRAEERVYLYLR